MILRVGGVSNVVGDEPFTKRGKRAVVKRRSDSSHEVQVKMEVMNRDQAKTENLFGFDQVPNVSAREGPASGAGTFFLNRAFVQAVRIVFQINRSDLGKGGAVPGKSRGEHTVKHVDSSGDHFDDLGRRSEAHGVPRSLRG